MQYKIIDNEGGGLKAGKVFNTKAELIQELADFHSVDFSNPEHKDIYAFLDTLKTEDEKLDFLCDHGSWSVEEIHTTREDIENILSELSNEDEILPALERAMEFYCGTWDKCEGYKHAILETLADQYDNHASEQDPKDLDKLSDILTGAI